MRVLVVSNMKPDAAHPERGQFVRDQVAALHDLAARDAGRGLEELEEIELSEFPPGPRALAAAVRGLRQLHRARGPFDVVHAHYGLTAWPALAVPARARGLTVHGTDVRHSRTRAGTRAVLPWMDMVAVPTAELARELPRRAARDAQVVPCGVDMERFRPRPRARARAELGLDPHTPCLLFPADPARPGKRYDRALALVRALASAGHRVELHTLGGVHPERVPLWVNAANVVVVPSAAEGFGLAVLEALACDVPVVATPVGVHPQALAGVVGAECAPFAVDRWRAAVEPHLRDSDPRIAGRARAERFSAARMATRLLEAWRAALEHSPARSGDRGE